MRADPCGPATLSEAPLSEIFELMRLHADDTPLVKVRGGAVQELRRRGLSWRQIEEKTGVPHASARRWLKRYLALA
jgi:hypothetical protein